MNSFSAGIKYSTHEKGMDYAVKFYLGTLKSVGAIVSPKAEWGGGHGLDEKRSI